MIFIELVIRHVSTVRCTVLTCCHRRQGNELFIAERFCLWFDSCDREGLSVYNVSYLEI
jgi:hypothetical protein